jgi:UDP-glucose 4-epimerase
MVSNHVFRNADIVITGGLGFIGANLARRLVSLEAKIRIIDSLVPNQGGTTYNIKDFSSHVEVTRCDLRDKDQLRDCIGNPKYIFNLAGQSSHWDSMVDPITDLEINCHSQLSLLKFLHDKQLSTKIIFASTRQIYGRPSYLPVDEAHTLNPVDINGIHRIASEKYHILYSSIYGLQSVILRLTNTIGPCMRVKDARQTFMGIWIRSAIEGVPFHVWGGDQLRDLNYVEDVVDAFLLAAESERASGKIYNLGATPALSLKELAELLRNITGCDYIIEEFPDSRKLIDIGDYYGDYRRIWRELGWKPKTSVRESLERTLDYYKKHLANYL